MKSFVQKHIIISTQLIAVAIVAAFMLAGMPVLNMDYPYQTYCDGALRTLAGVVALLILRALYKDDFAVIFKHKIPKCTWLFLIPFAMALVVYILMFALAEEVSFTLLPNFFVNWITQITSGFWEEAVCRGIFMFGMLKLLKGNTKGRLFTIGATGLLFGLLHFMSLFFGASLESAFDSMLFTFCWGMYAAAIYMYSGNIVLVMVMHAVWDIIVRIPEFFVVTYPDIPLLYYTDTIMTLLVLPITAICICIFAFKKESA